VTSTQGYLLLLPPVQAHNQRPRPAMVVDLARLAVPQIYVADEPGMGRFPLQHLPLGTANSAAC
jgi:hypothetical protein